MDDNMKKINEIASKYTAEELLQAFLLKTGFDLNKIRDRESTSNNTPPLFKGKKALVGDYFNPSFSNTKEVLESLGIEVIREETEPGMYNRIKDGEKFDVIITNNIYRVGDSGPELLKKLKQLDGFNTPVIIHTVSDEPVEYFIHLGFDGCLKKPITQDEVINVLNKVFKLI